MSVAVASPLRYSHSIGVLGHGGRGFSNPIDVAIRDDGVMFVVNRSNPTQGPPGGLRIGIIRVDDQEFLGDFGSHGTEDGQFYWITAIALDRHEQIYIADEYRHDVQVFDRDGTFLRKWGSFGSAPGQFNRPSGLAISPDVVYVVDHLNHRIQKLTPAGEPLGAWGSQGTGPGQFDLPWGIAVDRHGDVYVADWRNDRVQKLSPDGKHLATFGESGAGEGQLIRPSGVDVDADGNVYVADWGNNRVTMFDPGGRHLTTLIGDSGLSAWAEEGMKGNLDLVQEREGMDLTPEMRFWGPTAVKVDARGHVVVADSCRHRLQVYRRA